jgi:hypothetical protein
MAIQNFEDLEIWKEARCLTREILQALSRKFFKGL